MPDDGNTGADPGWPRSQPQFQRPDADAGRSAPQDTGEQPTIAHENLQRLRDERVSANSDGNSNGHSGGIPLLWPDDNG